MYPSKTLVFIEIQFITILTLTFLCVSARYLKFGVILKAILTLKNMTPAVSSKLKISKSNVEAAVRDTSTNKKCLFHLDLKDFLKSVQVSFFKSKQYEKYMVLCYASTRYDAG